MEFAINVGFVFLVILFTWILSMSIHFIKFTFYEDDIFKTQITDKLEKNLIFEKFIFKSLSPDSEEYKCK